MRVLVAVVAWRQSLHCNKIRQPPRAIRQPPRAFSSVSDKGFVRAVLHASFSRAHFSTTIARARTMIARLRQEEKVLCPVLLARRNSYLLILMMLPAAMLLPAASPLVAAAPR